jgi:hypothetical protein
MQAGNKMQLPKEASRYHQEEFSFKGGSHPNTQNLSTFLAFSNLEDEISFKGGSL